MEAVHELETQRCEQRDAQQYEGHDFGGVNRREIGDQMRPGINEADDQRHAENRDSDLPSLARTAG